MLMKKFFLLTRTKNSFLQKEDYQTMLLKEKDYDPCIFIPANITLKAQWLSTSKDSEKCATHVLIYYLKKTLKEVLLTSLKFNQK